MNQNHDVKALLSELANDDPRIRVIALQDVARDPTGDPELLGRLEPLMADTTPTLLWLPYAFGEVRWEAAKALAAERAIQNIDTAVRLVDVPKPMKAHELGSVAESHGVFSVNSDSVNARIEEYRILRDRQKLPRVTVQLHPPRSGSVPHDSSEVD